MTQQILRDPDVLARTGLSKASRDRLEKKGHFPKRVAISPRSRGWLADEIDAWITSRPKAVKE